MVATDSTKIKSGSTKVNFVCAKRVFSLLVSPALEKFTENLVCEEIILKMNIPIFDRQCETISIGGVKTEAVGFIKTTVQCLSNGFQAGTTYIKARVVRDFYKHFGSDGLCSEKLRNKLKKTEPTDDNDEEVDTTGRTDVKKAKQPKASAIRKSRPSSPLTNIDTSPSPQTGQLQSSTPKRKSKEDKYSNKSVFIRGKQLSSDEHKSSDRYAYFHLGRPIPSELWNVAMPHGRLWCNPCCRQDSGATDDCGYYDYTGQSCGSKCPGHFCDHNSLKYSAPDGECVAPPDHMLHVYHDVVDLPDPQLDGTQDGSPPSSPPPACQGNYIQYSVLNSVPWQRSPGGGRLRKWTPWYYDRRTHNYSYTMPEDFDPDGSFHSVRTMSSLASSFNGTYASDGSNLYKLEETGPAYFLQPGWDDLEASQLQSSSQPQHLQPGWDVVLPKEASHLQSSSQPYFLQPGWDDLETSQLQSQNLHHCPEVGQLQSQHLLPSLGDLEASQLQSSSLPHHVQPGWDYTEVRQFQSSQDKQYTIVDQAIVHKMFLNGQVIPAALAHVPQPHGEQWCHADCPWLGSGLPYECGYHPDWGNIIPCSQTCPGGYCAHTKGLDGGKSVKRGLFDSDEVVDQG